MKMSDTPISDPCAKLTQTKASALKRGLTEVVEMDPHFVLFQSMRESKTLAGLVLVELTLAIGFIWFLSKMAGR